MDGHLSDIHPPEIGKEKDSELEKGQTARAYGRYQNAATIRLWAAEDRKKSAPPARNRDYSVKEDETV